MDIFNSMTAVLDKEQTLPMMMIAPSMATIPEDGMLKYKTFTDMKDLVNGAASNEVVLFNDQQGRFLELVCEYGDILGYNIVVVTGIPATTYTPEFDSTTYALHKIAYHTVVNDLIEANRRANDSAAEVRAGSITAREQDSFTRKSGDVKVFTGYEEPLVEGED